MNSLKICVIGAGKWGLNHIKTLDDLGVSFGIVDSDEKKLVQLKKTYPDSSLFLKIEDAFKLNFNAYIVATPPSTHFVLAKQIIEKKKPVLVEKPLTLNLHDAIELNNLAKANNVNLMVGHLLLFHPAFVKIKSMINEGVLGKVQYIYSNRLNLGSFRNDENVLWSFAPHDISLFNFYFEESPKSLSSAGIDILQQGIHDTSITTFKYSAKRMGHIFVSWLHPFKEHRFVIIGSKGMIHFEDSIKSKPLIFHNKSVELNGDLPVSKSGNNYEIHYNDEMPLKVQLEYFISKINGGIIEIANGDSAVEVMRVLDLATKSLKN